MERNLTAILAADLVGDSRLMGANEAIAETKKAIALYPDFTVSAFAAEQPYKDPALLDPLLDSLRAAGLT